MEKRILVIIYGGDDWDKTTPLEKSPETRASFEEFYAYADAHGVNVFRASIKWYDRESGTFLKAWTFSENRWIKIEKPIRPDAVFDKVAGKHDYELFELRQGMLKRFPIVNSPLFRTMFDNKLSQYLAFPEFMPTSYLAENGSQFDDVMGNIRTDKVVLKEVYGSGGKQVVIGDKASIDKGMLSFPILVQEFVKTAGIPGFSEPGAVADLRLVYIGDELVCALSRIAKKGSLFTNFHQGATVTLVPEDSIPETCRSVSERIREKLALFPGSNYSLDFMFATDGRPLFIEMNTTPGFDLLRLVGTPEIRNHYYEKLLSTLA